VCADRPRGGSRSRLCGYRRLPKIQRPDARHGTGDLEGQSDASLGNKGPQCRSSIISGVFASRSEFGAVSGPVIVGVEGFEQRPDKEFPVPLFPRYTFKTEIPKGRATLDIVVPENVVTPRR
jgi:hypothetical protein